VTRLTTNSFPPCPDVHIVSRRPARRSREAARLLRECDRDAALSGGAEVIGVFPRALLDREIAHRGLTTLHLVSSMHERKALMESSSDGFVALPGGYRRLDEFFEIVTWAQLQIHAKPRILINTDGLL